ncbi:hypothetical protein F4777DRAFT_110737 [Nemania sp. FL0916]|nr:hypothetical protein F4777DRAFT_110737 [Nemania sp. FL0916]
MASQAIPEELFVPHPIHGGPPVSVNGAENTELWLASLGEPQQLETGVASSLFDSTVELLIKLRAEISKKQVMSSESHTSSTPGVNTVHGQQEATQEAQVVSTSQRNAYETIWTYEIERLYLWGHGVGVESGRLDEMLLTEPELGIGILLRLCELRELSIQCLSIYSFDNREIQELLTAETSRSEKLSRSLNQILEENTEAAILSYSLLENSPSASYEDISVASNLVKVNIDCLMDLSLTFEDCASDLEREPSNFDPMNTHSLNSNKALIYSRRIRDKFPSAPQWLIDRLAEANRIRSDQIMAQRLQFFETHDLDNSRSSKTAGSSRPTTLESVFDDHPNDTMSIATPASLKTTKSTIDQGRIRVPAIPSQPSKDGWFTCPFCSRTLHNALTRLQWKAHVFSDLRPLLCVHRECQLPGDDDELFFNSTHEWKTHHLAAHQSPNWTGDACPLCMDGVQLTPPPVYFKHMARHLREISLISIPSGLLSSEDSSSDDEDDDDAQNLYLPRVNDFEKRQFEKGQAPTTYPSKLAKKLEPRLNMASEKPQYLCDWKRCERSELPFHRLDHMRDHYRVYHMEDIVRRSSTPYDTSWWSSRKINPKWWRCTKCLQRISVEDDGYMCRRCGLNCQMERQNFRSKMITERRSNTN